MKIGLVGGASKQPPHRKWDLIVAGGGPAAMSAAIYAARYNLDTLVLEGMTPGGQLALTARIENYPGVPGATGADLAGSMRTQVEQTGSTIRSEIVRRAWETEDAMHVATDSAEYRGSHLMIATGAAPKRLGVPGEDRLHGRGVSYCATCDAPFFRDARVMVVGGGDSAVKEALHLADFASLVTLIHRRNRLRAEPILAERIKSAEGVEILWTTNLLEIEGESSVEAARLDRDGQSLRLELDGVFIYVGRAPATGPFSELVDLNEDGTVITERNVLTSNPRVVAAGDVTDNGLRQIVTAVGDGARAATTVYERVKG